MYPQRKYLLTLPCIECCSFLLSPVRAVQSVGDFGSVMADTTDTILLAWPASINPDDFAYCGIRFMSTVTLFATIVQLL